MLSEELDDNKESKSVLVRQIKWLWKDQSLHDMEPSQILFPHDEQTISSLSLLPSSFSRVPFSLQSGILSTLPTTAQVIPIGNIKQPLRVDLYYNSSKIIIISKYP